MDGRTPDARLPQCQPVLLHGPHPEQGADEAKKEVGNVVQDGPSWRDGPNPQVPLRGKEVEETKCEVRSWLYEHLITALGEDWTFLGLLGLLMALVSWAMDYISAKGLELYKWLYILVDYSVWMQYLVWVLYPLALILFATIFCQIVSPQAVGSGIPELKTIIRGAVMHEYLTFRTFVAKAVGLTAVLSTGLPVGKEGPFVHIASICAALLSKLLCLLSGSLEERYSLRSDVLTVGCAVGIGCCFGTPLGGVLFSIEVTCTYFAVSNYWRGFLGGTFSAFVFRILSVWIKDAETITALFKTNFRGDFPFDLQEFPAFAIIGITCGFFGAFFVYVNRLFVLFLKKRNTFTRLLMKQNLIFPTVLTFIITTLSFPPGLGQYMGAELMPRETINSLFDNYTWTKTSDPRTLGHSATWFHPQVSVFIVLGTYFVMNFWMAAVACTMPIPCGAFIPVFNLGAALGRIVGETMSLLFPEGLTFHGNIYQILPGGYAVIGAAAMTGAMTHTVSTAVICFELTGDISHILPMMVAVILANMVAQCLQPSLYDSIIQVKKLPYLPELASSHLNKYSVSVSDIMVRNISSVAATSTFSDLLQVLRQSKLKTFPFVDSPDSMILLGSVDRTELQTLIACQLGREQEVPTAGAERGTETRTGSRGSDAPGHSSFPYIDQEDGDPHEREGLKLERRRSTEQPRPATAIQQTDSCDPMSHRSTLRDLFCPKSRPAHEGESVQVPAKFEEPGTSEDIMRWKEREANVNFEMCRIDPAPFQLTEKTSLQKTHTLFSRLGLNCAYVTRLGRLVGVVSLHELQSAIEGTYKTGIRFRPPLASFRDAPDSLKPNRMPATLPQTTWSFPSSDPGRNPAIPEGMSRSFV